MSDLPAHDELADDEDERDWSWDALTGGVREELSDDDLEGYVLFAGVPEDQVEAHAEALRQLGGA